MSDLDDVRKTFARNLKMRICVRSTASHKNDTLEI